MTSFREWSSIATAAAACMLLGVACSQRGTPQPRIAGGPAFLSAQLVELEHLPVPSGVDPAVWGELKSGLRSSLEGMRADDRRVSTPPLANASQAELEFDEGTGTLSWGYNSNGDYDQNGEVNIADLTPLGLHFGEVGPFAASSANAMIDGDSNGEINLADLAPIGRSFGAVFSAYNIYTSANASDAPNENDAVSTLTPIGTMTLAQSTGSVTTDRRQFSFTVAGPVDQAYYWVRPGDGAAEGTRSNLAGGPPNDPPFAALSACPFDSPDPFEATFDASASQDDGGIVAYRWDFDNNGLFELVTDDQTPTAAHFFDAPGSHPVTVEVVDERGDTSRATVQIVVGPDRWAKNTLTDTPHGYRYQYFGVADGRPAAFIYKYDEGTGTDFFVGSDVNGTDWTSAHLFDAPPAGLSFTDTFLTVAGNPAVFAGGVSPGGNDAIYLYHAVNPQGSAWATPVLVVEDDPLTVDVGESGSPQAAAIIGGMPALAFLTPGDSGDGRQGAQLKYVAATSADGSAWGQAHAVSMPSTDPNKYQSAVGMVEADGMPALLHWFNGGSALPAAGSFSYLRGTSADGSAWAAPTYIEDDGFPSTLTLVDGRPAFVYHDRFGSGSPEKLLHYVIAADAQGSAWNDPVPIPHTQDTFGQMLEVAGVPALAFERSNTIFYLEATHVDGTSWLLPDPVDCTAGGYFRPAFIELAGQPALMYTDATFVQDGLVRYARRIGE